MAVTSLSVQQQVASIFLSYFQRAPEFEAMAWYSQQLNELLQDNDPETAYKLLSAQVYTDGVRHGEVPAPAGMSNAQYVNYIYQNVLGREADEEGFKYWTVQLDSGDIERAELVAIVINAALNGDERDATYVSNRTEVAVEFAQWENSAPNILDSLIYDAKQVLEGVDETPESVAAAQAKMAENANPPAPAPDTMLTPGIDNLVGSDDDDVFTAPIVQNDLGNTTLTLQSGDTIDGGDGWDTLKADLQASASNAIIGTAISPTTYNVEVIELRQQGTTLDQNVNWSDVDAENMHGIQELWSVNSRGDIQVEDVRVRPEDITIGMRETDGQAGNIFGASLGVYFDPAQLLPQTSARDSALTLTLDSISEPGDLTNVKVDGFSFSLGGESYTLRSDAIGEATNHEELLEAIKAAIEENPDLEGVEAYASGPDTITLVDSEGRPFETGSWTFIDGQVPADGDAIWAQQVGEPVVEDVPLRTNVELDFVGRSAQGGYLNIAGMNDAGIEVFDVAVDGDSWISGLFSAGEFFGQNNLLVELLAAISGNSFDHIEGNHYLETVNLTNIGANGDLKIGWALKDETGELDGRTVAGLWDVREVLDQGFVGDLTYGVVLTEDAFERYLNHADDVVLFRYEGGSGNDNITIEDWDDVAGDPDFAMVADLGDGHDRLNIDIATVSSVSVDGGDGRNTIAVVNSHGTTKANTFEHFANFQTYEVEGDADTAHDFTSMAGVDTIIIATEGDTSTTLIDAEADADITVTGKNQTLEDGNSDQTFASIAVLGSEAEDLTITLENTARLDGELTLESLVVNDHNHDGDLHESAVRTLNIESNGRRDTANTVESIIAPRVTTLNLEGTQDLAVRVDDMASNPSSEALTIDASELEGDATVAIAEGVLNRGNQDTVTGTAGENDVLQMLGQQNGQATKISGFETIQFGGEVIGQSDIDKASGVFNAQNVSGVDLYSIQGLDPDAVSGDIADAEARVAEAEAAVAAAQAEVDAWQAVADAERELEEAEHALPAAEDAYNDAANALDEANQELADAEDELAAAQADKALADADLAGAVSVRNAAQADVNAAQEDLDNAEEAVATLQDLLIERQDDVDNAQAAKDAADAAVTDAQDALDAAQADVNAALATRDAAQTAENDATTARNTAQAARDSAQGDVDALQALVVAYQGALANYIANPVLGATALVNAFNALEAEINSGFVPGGLTDFGRASAIEAADATLIQPAIAARADVLNSALADAETVLADAEDALVAAQAALATAEAALSNAEAVRDAAQGALNVALAEQSAAATALTNAENALSATETALGVAIGIRDTAQSDLEAAEAALAAAQADVDAATAAVVAAAAVVHEAQLVADAAAAAQAAAQAAYEEAAAELEAAEKRVEDAEQALEDAEEALANLPPQAGNPEVAQRFLDEAQSELADAEAELLAATQVFIMENLSAGETNVLVDGENANANITFIAGAGNLDDAQASNYTLNLEVDGDEYDSTFTINDFGTVNLSLIDVEGTEDHYEFGLDFDTTTKNLVVSGGDAEGSVILDDIETSLTHIDFSEVVSQVALTLEDMGDDNTNTTIVVNDRAFYINEAAVTTDVVTTYVFTADVAGDEEVWTIEGFQAFNAAGGSLSNVSILDLSALGVNGLADIIIEDYVSIGGGGTLITSNEGLDFVIDLVGVSSADLNNENFIFAL